MTEEGLKEAYVYQLEYTDKLVLPKCERSGYNFLYWADEQGNEIGELNSLNLRDCILKAVWQSVNIVYEINYILNGGIQNAENPSSGCSGQSVILKEPEREGYIFLGWQEENSGGFVDNYYIAVQDITLTASFIKDINIGSAAESAAVINSGEKISVVAKGGDELYLRYDIDESEVVILNLYSILIINPDIDINVCVIDSEGQRDIVFGELFEYYPGSIISIKFQPMSVSGAMEISLISI